MLCKNTHDIYVIDVQACVNNWDVLTRNKIVNEKALQAYMGDREQYIETLFAHKSWYDRTPSAATNQKEHWLWLMGFYKHYKVPCGKCEVCKVERSKEWATKAWCEQQMWENTCFITLTYDNEHLPEDRKLKRSDIQKFWKDLRYHLYKETKYQTDIDFTEEKDNLQEQYTNEEIKFNQAWYGKKINPKPIRYLNCGEYGPKTKRPHYHAQIWNFCPTDLKPWKKDERGYWLYNSKKLAKLWGKGYVVIEQANSKTAGYVARYCTKKYTRTEDEEQRMKEKKQIEFIGASSLGYIGWTYWEKNKQMIKRNMGILMKENDHTILRKLPKIMQKKWEEEDPIGYEEYDYWKCKIGEENWKKILKETSLTEEEYIEQAYKQRMRRYQLLKREKGDIQGYL